MARRSAPPGSGPAYMTPAFGGGAGAPPHARGRVTDAKQQQEKEDGSAFSRFFREEIVAPQYIAGNINILTSIAIFAAGVFAILRELTIDLFIPQEPGPRHDASPPIKLAAMYTELSGLVVNSCPLTQTILST
ncbi:hypothetical protein A7U60_g3304 [Sanghuangporus baumii]|uniref:Uncharacterized protein n=1 Tax=Sanghuangporus baumii TaxID=108892 RepID=A0A9Q5ND79_SANBA|nr:hypothetical protein A7U60_g3304 [Sanghuangporus baumii]